MNADVEGLDALPSTHGRRRGTPEDRDGTDSPVVKGRLVVAVALLDDDRRVLAARRREPHPYAGMWEFPGGKVEPGEHELDALVRECREELDVEIEVGPPLGEVGLSSPGWVLRVWLGRVTRQQPRLVEHDELRWLGVAELDDVRWMPADGPLVAELRRVLSTPGSLF
ncbi:ADP-ribose pyrophosphatase [Frankia casuarinae]|jgi:8-oxo-dGTP diphosphatase|uniref:8-oxo-dGTP diphosphatase n=1 Tax=Frankia casuarinae (strain DSM 45818 / CECT 9043 / HFP020203 / CcI3) TaxID=106370 RepID=Q2J676_FRACC|nr:MULTISPECIES: (deoxy)nucleoside triphosphate pyrophosphohydrolase [Frankia]ABD13216.1 NUDIX hydrolase [Frankia casuarinae]ETA03914.1 ADP-ribose pyrophosphatase [Frankia sp. CcI6]EYT93735.1 ADP-ribose pyrophosphatase [Frankia casuarinae]KDA40935.1 ADP-ribose pyrophosphatase [Frankia sp. BMG5.23]OAA26318.1 8-oxo-dGTP diphosphatase [Frankia casuarinae]